MQSLNRKIYHLKLPLDQKALWRLKAGDEVFLTGEIFTARDQAHKRLIRLLAKGHKLPLSLKESVIYYCGPTKTPRGQVIGSCGPTTSSRMDPFVGPLLDAGLRVMIGKGRRRDSVRRLIKKHRAIYFLATGGIGALLSKKVLQAKKVCFSDLGPEAVYKLKIQDFPVIVGIDAHGRDVFSI